MPRVTLIWEGELIGNGWYRPRQDLRFAATGVDYRAAGGPCKEHKERQLVSSNSAGYPSVETQLDVSAIFNCTFDYPNHRVTWSNFHESAHLDPLVAKAQTG